MAENVLGSLFQDIADAIRSRTGGTDKMAPNDFPDEILSIVAGGSVEGDDGTAVRATTGWIYTDRSGIYRQTITHGLGVVPDLVLVSNGNWLGLTNAQKEANPLMFVWGAHSKFKTAFSGTLCGAACTIQGITLSNGNDKGIDEYSPTDVFISCPDNNTFEFGMSESSYNGYYGLVAPDDEGTEGVYKWIAITGMGGTVSDGSGSAEGCVTVTFMNGDTVLFTRPVYSGDTCANPVEQGRIETPTRASTAQYDYAFNGWATVDGGTADSTALQNITADTVLYAAYASSLRKYTVRFYDGDTLLHTEQVEYGKSSSYVPNKEGYTLIKWTPEPTNITGDTDCIATFTEAFDFQHASWDYIATIAESGRAAENFAIGDTKVFTISLPDSTPIDMTVEIVGFNHDTLSDDSGTAGISVMTKYLMPQTRRMSNDGTHTWATSELRAFCNGELFNALPSTLKPHIKEVKKAYNNHGSRGAATVADKCWVPSHTECGVTYGTTSGGGTLILALGTTYQGYTDGVIQLPKSIFGKTSTVTYWWYRAVHNSATYYFARQYYNKTSANSYHINAQNASTNYCFGFCI